MSLLLALALQTAASPAASAPPPVEDVAVSGRIERGMPIVDPQGAPVGNVASVDGDTLVVDTGSRRVAFSTSEFRMRSGGLVLGLSRSDVDQAGSEIERSIASSRASLMRVGVGVVGADGLAIGSVRAVQPGFLLVALVPDGSVLIPDHAFAGADGHLVMGTTLAALRQMIAAR